MSATPAHPCTYDGAGRITNTRHGNAGLNRTYGYDVLDRLIEEVAGSQLYWPTR